MALACHMMAKLKAYLTSVGVDFHVLVLSMACFSFIQLCSETRVRTCILLAFIKIV